MNPQNGGQRFPSLPHMDSSRPSGHVDAAATTDGDGDDGLDADEDNDDDDDERIPLEVR